MKLIPTFIDFETYWDTTHSLTKLSPMEYVLSPITEVISCSIKIGNGKTQCTFGEENVRALLSSIDWSDKFLIAHNNEGFDSMLSAWRFGVNPAMWGCTLAMARPHHAKTTGLSLKALCEHYALGVKDVTALVNTKGKHLKDFTADEVAAMEAYNKEDVELCAKLFINLLPKTPQDELKLIDATIRMLVEPKFEVDVPMLETALQEEKKRKAELIMEAADVLGIAQLSLTPDEVAEATALALRSNQKLADLLNAQGVAPPMKTSKTTGQPTFAFAKTDQEFLELAHHPNPIVAAAVSARLGIKSSILETRIQTFINIAKVCDGKLPVPLKYYGADTTGRWSGWEYNPQNLPRIDPKNPKPSDVLRKCLKAPKGYKVVVADLSGIELRVNHFLWKVPSSMARFREDPEKADLYKEFASALYSIRNEEVSKEQRQVGKVAQLGLGFGAGADTFKKVARTMASINMSESESASVVSTWRSNYPEIVRGWKTCHNALGAILVGADADIDPWGMCSPCDEGIKTPKGVIRYPHLRQEINEQGKVEYVYGDGRNQARIYAGKVDENCLAEGTLVLTDSGWKPIELVGLYDRVHDGNTFVSHAGIVLKSVQPCVNVDGVFMTADHEVLDENGVWKEASQVSRPYRPDVRSADRLKSVAYQREDVVVGVSMSLRRASDKNRQRCNEGVEAWGDPKLRVPIPVVDSGKKQNTRAVEASALWGVQEHARPLSRAFAQSMEKLRGAWNSRVQQVGSIVRELLGRHAPDVPERTGFGPTRQRRAVLSGELSLGQSKSQYAEQTEQSRCGHILPVERDGGCEVNTILQTEARTSSNHKVYDILNVGPLHRFVVLGENGPFVVHNCVQHLARCVLADNIIEINRRTGLWPALMVHDELVFLVPEENAQAMLDTVQSIMRTPPTWWPELVTWSEGDIGDTYGDAK